MIVCVRFAFSHCCCFSQRKPARINADSEPVLHAVIQATEKSGNQRGRAVSFFLSLSLYLSGLCCRAGVWMLLQLFTQWHIMGGERPWCPSPAPKLGPQDIEGDVVRVEGPQTAEKEEEVTDLTV
jgi:hypothetical protein